MRIIIEIDEKEQARVTNNSTTDTSGSNSYVVDTGQAPNGQAQRDNGESSATAADQGSMTQGDAIDAGEVPSELLELMAGLEEDESDKSTDIDSGSAAT